MLDQLAREPSAKDIEPPPRAKIRAVRDHYRTASKCSLDTKEGARIDRRAAVDEHLRELVGAEHLTNVWIKSGDDWIEECNAIFKREAAREEARALKQCSDVLCDYVLHPNVLDSTVRIDEYAEIWISERTDDAQIGPAQIASVKVADLGNGTSEDVVVQWGLYFDVCWRYCGDIPSHGVPTRCSLS